MKWEILRRWRPRRSRRIPPAIDFSLCLYCGICIEVCPFDALHWSPEHSYAGAAIGELTHERDRLAGWEATAPAPADRDT